MLTRSTLPCTDVAPITSHSRLLASRTSCGAANAAPMRNGDADKACQLCRPQLMSNNRCHHQRPVSLRHQPRCAVHGRRQCAGTHSITLGNHTDQITAELLQ